MRIFVLSLLIFVLLETDSVLGMGRSCSSVQCGAGNFCRLVQSNRCNAGQRPRAKCVSCVPIDVDAFCNTEHNIAVLVQGAGRRSSLSPMGCTRHVSCPRGTVCVTPSVGGSPNAYGVCCYSGQSVMTEDQICTGSNCSPWRQCSCRDNQVCRFTLQEGCGRLGWTCQGSSTNAGA